MIFVCVWFIPTSRALRGLLKCSAMYSGVCSAPKTREKHPRFSLEKYERWEYCVSAVHFHRGRRREGGGGVTKAIESRGRTALSRRCQCGRDCLRLGVARGRRREVAQMIRLIGWGLSSHVTLLSLFMEVQTLPLGDYHFITEDYED